MKLDMDTQELLYDIESHSDLLSTDAVAASAFSQQQHSMMYDVTAQSECAMTSN